MDSKQLPGARAEAERLCRDVIDARMQELGPSHFDTLKAKGLLVSGILSIHEHWDEMERFFKEIITGYTQQLGAASRETVIWEFELATDRLSKSRSDDTSMQVRSLPSPSSTPKACTVRCGAASADGASHRHRR